MNKPISDMTLRELQLYRKRQKNLDKAKKHQMKHLRKRVMRAQLLKDMGITPKSVKKLNQHSKIILHKSEGSLGKHFKNIRHRLDQFDKTTDKITNKIDRVTTVNSDKVDEILLNVKLDMLQDKLDDKLFLCILDDPSLNVPSHGVTQ